MPEETTTVETTPAKTAGAATEAPDLAAELDKWKAMARKNEDRAKANAKAADEATALKARLDEIEAANLTELDRAKKEAADVKAALEAATAAQKQAELAALRASIGAEKGLPPALISRLTGDDADAIKADADALLAAIPKQDPSLDIGQGKTGKTEDPDIAAFAKALGVA